MAKVWGPVIVESLGLGGACASVLFLNTRNKKQVIIMEKYFRINLDLLKYGFTGECVIKKT
jgi:hypothetical protein